MTSFVFLALTLTIYYLMATTSAQFNRNWQFSPNCITPENYQGSCVGLSYCPQVTQVFQKTDRRTAMNYVIALQRICGTRNIGGDPLVCCTRPVNPQATNQFTATTTEATNKLPNWSPAEEDTFVLPKPVTYPLTTKVPNWNPFLITTTTTTSTTPASTFNRYLVKPTPVTPVNYGTIPRRLPYVEEGCGYSAVSTRKIVGGREARKGAYPWIALVGYDKNSSEPFKCGGTLITARHVLTAAHCLKYVVTFVRLGEHDLSTDTETEHIDIPVSKVTHPEYNRRNGRSDIAVLYLERNVEFTSLILPICMPIAPSLRSKSYAGTFPYVIGWGKTMEDGPSATVLNELMIPVLENEVCRSSYAKLNRNFTPDQFDKAVICAGTLAGGKDTCYGDSGGPLMTSEGYGDQTRFYLIGVVAYGVGCARPEIPGVYTSTQYFMDWILEKLEDTP